MRKFGDRQIETVSIARSMVLPQVSQAIAPEGPKYAELNSQQVQQMVEISPE